jgi:hypothetical protein
MRTSSALSLQEFMFLTMRIIEPVQGSCVEKLNLRINWKSQRRNSAFCSYLYFVILFEITNFDICTVLGYTAQGKASFYNSDLASTT